MNSKVSALLVIIAIAAAVAFAVFWHPQKKGGLTQSGNNTSVADENSSTDVNQDLPEDDFDGTPYGVDEQANQFYVLGSDGQRTTITTPFDLASYHGTPTLWGTLFWKRGGERSEVISGFNDGEPYTFEDGIDPEFQWYDIATKKFSVLPPLTLKKDGTKFERIYGVVPSVSEQKILIEVGEYDTASDTFAPGLVDEQPVQTHGVVYNVQKLAMEGGDPLTTYRQALNVSSTLLMWMSWDSKQQQAVAIPGGEGCGGYDVLKFVNLKTKAVTDVGGSGSFTFKKEDCNPTNGVSPDSKWFALYGSTTDNKNVVMVFNFSHGSTPVKQKEYAVGGDPLYIQSWDTTKAFPIMTFSDGSVVDLNT